jgi:signal peptidase I
MEPAPQTETTEDIGKIKHIFDFVKSVRWFINAYIALTAFFLIKKFAFDIVRANNNDMNATYLYGDAVLIKKTFNTYEKGDAVYLEYPIKDSAATRTFFIQRIFGCPGDTLEIKNKIVFVNRMEMQSPGTIKYNYYIRSKNLKLDSVFRSQYNLNEGGPISDEYDYSFSLTNEEYQTLKRHSLIDTIEDKMEKSGVYDENCFPFTSEYPWNMDNYGKIYIPKLNDTLKLDTLSVKLYSRLIKDLEKNNLRVSRDSIFINNELTNKYIVKKNYYFVLGDNRDNAVDSRSWGYLPENFIKGKVLHTVRSSK